MSQHNTAQNLVMLCCDWLFSMLCLVFHFYIDIPSAIILQVIMPSVAAPAFHSSRLICRKDLMTLSITMKMWHRINDSQHNTNQNLMTLCCDWLFSMLCLVLQFYIDIPSAIILQVIMPSVAAPAFCFSKLIWRKDLMTLSITMKMWHRINVSQHKTVRI
jgi:hypothetical protein